MKALFLVRFMHLTCKGQKEIDGLGETTDESPRTEWTGYDGIYSNGQMITEGEDSNMLRNLRRIYQLCRSLVRSSIGDPGAVAVTVIVGHRECFGR